MSAEGLGASSVNGSVAAGDEEPAASYAPRRQATREAQLPLAAAAEPMAPRGAWWARGGRPCGRRAPWRYVWHEVPINGRVINGPSAADQSTRLSIMGCYN